MRFVDRRAAGRSLAERLMHYRERDAVVLALPRGGVPVAFEVAQALKAALDVFLVRKLGLPGHEELAMGAIASRGVCYVNEDVVAAYGVDAAVIEAAARRERLVLERAERDYRGDRPALALNGRMVLLVDDGLATGASMRAAVLAVRQLSPARVVVAVPVAPAETVWALSAEVDELVCLLVPEAFRSVGAWYEDFTQVSEAQVRALLAENAPDVTPSS